MKKLQDYLKSLGYKGAALKNDALLKMAQYCVDNNIDKEDVNTKGNTFVQFPSDTPIVTDGTFVCTGEARSIDWHNDKGAYNPLFFIDGQLDGEYDGATAMSADVFAKELPEEASTLTVRTYKTKTGEIRATVNYH
jgi:hypothetical protein